MQKFIGLVLLIALFTGCGKVIEYSNNFSAVTFINASPGSPAINVFVDTMLQTASAIAYRASSGYLSVSPGARNLEVSAVVNFVKKQFLVLPSTNFEGNTASTFLVYDTLSTANQTLKYIRLSDTLTPPANGSVKVRFIPLAVNAGTADVTFLRTSVTPADSVTFTSRSYVGASPNANAVQTLSTFTIIPLGTYTVKMKAAGTQTILASSAFALNGGTGFTGIYTLYSTGSAQAQALSLMSFRHYP